LFLRVGFNAFDWNSKEQEGTVAKFPKQLFMKYEDGGTGDKYLGTYESATDAAVMGEKTPVAIYRLYEVHEVEGVVNTRKISKPR
jgi:hypothetical protein